MIRLVLTSSCLCAHRRVSSMSRTKSHFLKICCRWSCQRLGALRRPYRLFCSFQITVLLLESSVPGCHSGGGLAYTTSPSFIWASRKASFTSAVNSVTFVSEVCCLRVASSLMLSSTCWRKRLQPSRLPRSLSAHTAPCAVSAPTYH